MDVKIPLELLEYLDQGKNPQLYTKECLERTLNKNKEARLTFINLSWRSHYGLEFPVAKQFSQQFILW